MNFTAQLKQDRGPKRRRLVAGVTAAAMLVAGGIASADVVTNNVVAVDGVKIVSVQQGGTGQVTYGIANNDNSVDPVNGCNLAHNTTPRKTLTITPTGLPSGASADPVTKDKCEAFSITFSVGASTPVGDFPIAHTLTPANTESNAVFTNQAGFTLRVTAASTCTTTAPAAPTVAATPDAASTGWYNIATGAPTFTVAPAANAEYSLNGGSTWQAYTSGVSLTTDGQHSVTARNFVPAAGSCARVDGTASTPATFKVDRTSPSVSYTSATAGTGNGPSAVGGWYKEPVTATFTGTDTGSGFANGNSTLTGTASSGATQEGSTVAIGSPAFTDVAGNTAAAGVASQSFKIDLTPPTSAVTGVIANAIYGVAPNVGCDALDQVGLSGVATHGAPTGNSTTAGAKSVTCNGATDNAGNLQTAASPAVSYTVAPIGVFNPNFDGSAVLRVKPNQAIPLKWAFNDGTTNHALLSGATMSSVSSNRCTVVEGSDGTETATELATGSSGLQLLPDNSYQTNWKAPSTAVGCRALTVTMTFTGGGSTARTILVNVMK